ncbi:MAG: TatD family hydrolase, partial [Thermoanaerobaculia bacterium]
MGVDGSALLSRARAAGVTRFLVPGTTLADSEDAAALADPAAGIFAAVGVHPHEAKDFEPARDGARFEALARRPGVVAIGEIGLDFHYDHSPRPKQIEVLEWMLDCAARLGLPALLHNRESGEEILAALERRGAREN